MCELHNNLPFLTEKIKIEKVVLPTCVTKKKHVIRKRNFKQVLYHRLVFKKVYKVIKLNQKALVKPYINMNTKLRKKAKNDFEKNFFKLSNSVGFGNSWEI